MFAQWPIVEADLHSEYGIDTSDRVLLRSRSAWWLIARMDGLAACDSRINGWARLRHEKKT